MNYIISTEQNAEKLSINTNKHTSWHSIVEFFFKTKDVMQQNV